MDNVKDPMSRQPSLSSIENIHAGRTILVKGIKRARAGMCGQVRALTGGDGDGVAEAGLVLVPDGLDVCPVFKTPRVVLRSLFLFQHFALQRHCAPTHNPYSAL